MLAGADGPTRSGLPINELLAPLPLVALALLGVNDWILKPSAAPEWLTGKLSDFAGLFAFPLVATAAFDLLLLAAGAGRIDYTLRRWKLAVAIGLELIGFTILKLWPAGSDALVRVMRLAFPRTEVMMDATDLIAFVVLPATWWYGRRVIARGPYGRLAWARRRNATAPFDDAVACGAAPTLVTALHAAIAAGDPEAIASALERLRAG
jgi:hypothetical protein